jgi:ankyrin repeat protein
VKLLLEKGADVESKDAVGQTPLSRAATGGHKAVVKLLLEKGAEKLLHWERVRRRC